MVTVNVPVGGGEAFTLSVTVVECVKLPLEPVIVNVKPPVCAVVVVFTVSVELPDPLLILVGLKLPLAPVPKPLTLNDTVPVNPLDGDTVTVYVVLLP